MNLPMFGKINLNQTENSGHFVMNSKFQVFSSINTKIKKIKQKKRKIKWKSSMGVKFQLK